MRNVFDLDIVRSVTTSIGRFLAIAGIVALGCGFYAGLRMTAPDMRIAADRFYDGTQLYDILLVSTLGYSDSQLGDVLAVEGVQEACAAKSTDIMALLDGEQYTMRVVSFDAQAAQESASVDGVAVESADPSYLNRLVLAEGSWPTKAGECVLSADRVMGTPVQMGDHIEVLYGSQELDGVLPMRTLTVTGLVHSSAYVSAISFGSSSLGSGSIQQFVYVTEDTFDADFPYSEIFVRVAGAAEEFAGSDAYQDVVDTVVDRLKEASGGISKVRYDDVRGKAQDELDDARATAQSTLASARQQLADAQAQIDSGAAQLASGKDELAAGESEYAAGLAKWEEGNEQYQQSLALYEASAPQREQLADALAAARAAESALQARIDQAAAAGMSEDDPANIQMKQQLAALRAQIADLQAKQAEFDAAKAKLDAAKAALDEGQVTLAATRSQLDAAADELSASEGELARAQAQLDASWAEYREQEAAAASELSKAQDEVDRIDEPTIYVLDRTSNYGVTSYDLDAERVDNIARVFPFIFFLVAALVALTTMTRMVEEERVLIGTYKALGYSRARITGKYLVYAASASIIGAVIGIAVLSQVLPFVISKAYAIIYNVPALALPLPIDVPLALLSAGLGVGITLVATWAAAAATLREQPAALMLPRAPAAGKRILLQRIGPLWRNLSFSRKVTCRNLFRYKKRLWMTIAGIAGCTALLLTGLGLHDAIWDIIDKQFGPIVQYNAVIELKDDASEDDVANTRAYLEDTGGVTRMTRAERANMQIASASHDPLGIVIAVPADTVAFSDLVTFKERIGQEPIAFGEQSVVLTEKMASKLGVQAGDAITVYDQDEIGNPVGEGYRLVITDIMEYYVGHELFVGAEAWADAVGDGLAYRTIYGVCTEDVQERTAITDGLHARDEVETVAYNDETIDSYRKMLTSVNMIVVVLVVAAAGLAFIVLYNLTNINITERRREIASLKVLGFTRREVNAYIFREIILLTLIGAAVGLVLGYFLEGFVVTTAEVDYVMFGREIHPMSYLLGYIVTIAFSAVVMLAMRHKLGSIDMVESLKSIE